MTTDTGAAIAALQQALELERSGYRFYMEAAERTLDAKGSEMFRSLADDEEMHRQIIERQIDALGANEGWVLPEGIKDLEVDLAVPLFPKGKVDLEKAIRPDAGDLDALLFALKIENDSFDLYAGQAKAAQDPNARRLYESLAGAERTHFNLLMLNYESLSSNAGWVG
jgi:erythrin-vacuolar iron transport family protein